MAVRQTKRCRPGAKVSANPAQHGNVDPFDRGWEDEQPRFELIVAGELHSELTLAADRSPSTSSQSRPSAPHRSQPFNQDFPGAPAKLSARGLSGDVYDRPKNANGRNLVGRPSASVGRQPTAAILNKTPRSTRLPTPNRICSLFVRVPSRHPATRCPPRRRPPRRRPDDPPPRRRPGRSRRPGPDRSRRSDPLLPPLPTRHPPHPHPILRPPRPNQTQPHHPRTRPSRARSTAEPSNPAPRRHRPPAPRGLDPRRPARNRPARRRRDRRPPRRPGHRHPARSRPLPAPHPAPPPARPRPRRRPANPDASRTPIIEHRAAQPRPAAESSNTPPSLQNTPRQLPQPIFALFVTSQQRCMAAGRRTNEVSSSEPVSSCTRQT